MMSDINFRKSLPELLAPAGSYAALEAALEGGADAIYFGGSRFNARINAKNIGADDIPKAVELAHAHNAKVYFTLNTLATDRELPGLLDEARIAAAAGVDALIMADLGAAELIHRCIPDLPLHASTQASAHNSAAGNMLAELGFTRMVCAREMSLDNIRSFTKNSPIEAEVFVHGALCVCHSGQCLFSSMVGGRSGNRGECAQPCRLPFQTSGKNKYPLSLKDLCLAQHVPELIDAGVASLKIEGRMKSPEYVLAVTQVWRALLDQRRAANREEMDYLASIFSRGGFTDGYFVNKTGAHMLGVRSDDDKVSSRELPPFTGLTKKVPLDMDAVIVSGAPMKLTVSSGNHSVTVVGDIPETALKNPSDYDSVLRNMTKLGQTPYSTGKISLELDEGLAIPVSKLNALRRDAVTALAAAGIKYTVSADECQPQKPLKSRKKIKTARFISAQQIPDEAADYFDIIYLPLNELSGKSDSVNGVILPSVIFDSELDKIEKMLEQAAKIGIRHALIENIGQISLVKKYNFILHGDFRLNVTNSGSVAIYESLGFEDVILSPELTLPQIRDTVGNTQTIVYGRIPLMLLEKCVVKEVSGCDICHEGKASLTDRRGVEFPVMREEPHRNIIYNSQPTYMADRSDDLVRCGVSSQHFLFSVETKKEAASVIAAYKSGSAPGYSIRRI